MPTAIDSQPLFERWQVHCPLFSPYAKAEEAYVGIFQHPFPSPHSPFSVCMLKSKHVPTSESVKLGDVAQKFLRVAR